MTPMIRLDRRECSRSKQLKRQMRKWREALDRTTFPGLVGGKPHVTQEEIAVLCGKAVSHYGNLERGRIEINYSDEVLDIVARALRLGNVARRVLYLLATGREPKPGPFALPELTTAVRAKLACQPWPAYIIDSCFDVLEYNEAALRWFPHLRYETNVMRAIVCLPQLRHQLVDWETVHLPRALAQLKGHLAWPQHDERLDTLVQEILNTCPRARDVFFSDATVWMYEDGDFRQMYLPGATEPTTVQLSSEFPASNHGLRIVSVIPVNGHIPDECKSFIPCLAGTGTLEPPMAPI